MTGICLGIMTSVLILGVGQLVKIADALSDIDKHIKGYTND